MITAKVSRQRAQCNGEPQRRPDCVADSQHLGLVSVRLPRPEEAPESVLAAARHDMNMQVRDALAYPIVDRHQGAIGAEPRLYRRGQKSRLGE